MKSQIEISNRDSEGSLDIIWYNGLEIVVNNNPILLSWDDRKVEYGWLYALINQIDKKICSEFRRIELALSFKSLIESKIEIERLISLFVDGEYRISKYVTEKKQPGKYQRNSDTSIEIANKIIDKKNESFLEESFADHFVTTYERNKMTPTLLNWTTDGFPTLQDPIISLKSKNEIDDNLVNRYEQEIKNENFTYCLLFSNFSENEDSLNSYCIGTIEILIAYRNLGVQPRFIELKKINDESKKLDDDKIIELNKSLYHWQMNSIFEGYFNNPLEIQRILKLSEHPFKRFIKQGTIREYWPNRNLKSDGSYHLNKFVGIVKNYYPDGQVKSIWFYNNEGEKIRPIKRYFPTGQLQSEFIYNDGDEFGTNRTYRIDGSLSGISHYYDGVCYIMKDGKYYLKDGKSKIYYHENGRESYVAYYKDGKEINWEKFDINGKLIDEFKNSA